MSDLVQRFKVLLGESGVLEGAQAAEAARSNWSRLGSPRAILRPNCTNEVSHILRICDAERQAVIPWGGKTGLVEGANAVQCGSGVRVKARRRRRPSTPPAER
jgi:FAD/FMN-containing dehydrogenase